MSITKTVIYTNTKSEKDKFYFNFATGEYSWDTNHRDGLKNYIGDNGKKIQIMWEDSTPTMHHGW